MDIERPKKSETMNLLRTFKALSVSKAERPNNASYMNLSNPFLLKDNQKNYTQQYWKTYLQRLNQIKEYVFADLSNKGIPICERILNIKVGESQTVVATLYKDMKLKPSVMSQAPAKGNAAASNTNSSKINYMQDSDVIFMEDGTGRMQLAFKETRLQNPINSTTHIVNAQNLTTGVVLAIKGIQRAAEVNIFEVEEIFTCDLPHQEYILELPTPIGLSDPSGFLRHGNNLHELNHYIKNPEEANFILLTSGLNLSLNQQISSVNSLRNHILGLSSLKQVTPLQKRGNLIEKNKNLDYNMVGAYSKQEEFKTVYADINSKMRNADNLINSIATHVCLDIMPGDNDPTQAFLPQQPLSRYYFMKSVEESKRTLLLVPNPYKFEQEGIQVLGVSGQSLNDTKKYCKFSENDVDVLENHLLWRHISPTAPDTLQCFPFDDKDPFVIDDMPNVYFSGNSEKFETKMIYEQSTQKRCRLICVPTLSQSNSIVLLNLLNLDTFEVQL